MNLRERILSFKPSVASLEVPEWGCTVYVRTWSGHERAKFAALGQAEGWEEKARAFAYAAFTSLCEKDGTPIFKEEDFEDFYRTVDFGTIDRVANFALRHNKLTQQDYKEAKADFTETQS